MEKHNREQTTTQNKVGPKTEELNTKLRIKVINSFVFISLLSFFVFSCTRINFSVRGKDFENANSKILSVEYYENTKIIKRLVVERYVKCNNCRSKIYYVNKSNKLDSVVVNYDIINEEFEYYSTGNKKYYGILYEKFGNKYSIFWNENGVIESAGEFSLCNQTVFDTTTYPWTSTAVEYVKSGVWIIYNEKGEKEKTEIYENGVLKRD